MSRVKQLARYLCALMFITGCTAQTSQIEDAPYEGRVITDIQYVPSQPLAPQDLAKAQPLKQGEALHAEDVSRAIDGLFATGRFENIAVEAVPQGNGVTVRFIVTLTNFVGGMAVAGNNPNPPNRAQIEAAAQLTLGTPFHDANVTAAVQNINRLLKANGLYEDDVTPSVEHDDKSQQVFVTFQVKKGKRAKYAMPAIQGGTKLSDDTILRATGWRIPVIHWWRQVTESRTRDGVQGLQNKYAQQDRLEANVEIKDLDYDPETRRLRPNLAVTPGPQVKVTAVETKVSKRVLKRYVPIFDEGTVDNDLLTEGKRNLMDYFESQGYYDVDVQFRVQAQQDDVQRIEYVISRGQRYKLMLLTIAGNKYFDTDTIRERMFLTPVSLFSRHGSYSEAFVRKDEENIGILYRDNGFRDVKVTSSMQRNYRGKPDQIALTLNIEEGSQWFVDTLEIGGPSQVHLPQVRALTLASEGEPLSDVALGMDRQSILTYYYSQGYPDAAFDAAWHPSDALHRVNLVYTITEGDPQYVRDVLISGLKTTRRSLVNKKLKIKPGDPLSQIALTNIQKELYDFGVFERVDTAIQNPDGGEAYKNVLYNFEEADRYTLSLGIGAQIARFGAPSSTSLESPAGTTGFFPDASITATRLNFLGLGQMISARANYSAVEKRVSLSYLQPRFRNSQGRNVTYTLLYDQTLDVRTFASRREEASVQLSQKFTKAVTGLFGFAYRRVSVSDVIIPVLLIPRLVQPVRIGILTANLIQDRRDNPADPQHGTYNTATFGIASGLFGSTRNFGRLLLRNATYYRLPKHMVLARQTQFGIIQPFSPPSGISAQESVPLPERFFSGGADSIRAFGYDEAGPRDTGAPVTPGGPSSEPTGFPLGGNAIFINNIELRFPLVGHNLQGVFFHDLGNVYTNVRDISFAYHQRNLQDFNYAVQDAGFGIRYKTPVGPLRADLAYALNPPSFIGFNGTPLQLLQCGPGAAPTGPCQPVQQNTGHFQFVFSIGQTF
jgi:outer membrane protein insertion porin family